MDILFATSNIGKLKDVNHYLAGTGFVVRSPGEIAQQIGIAPFASEVDETGSTYEENAKLKSLELFQWSGMPTLADDSGLEVTALGGAPGLYSARYAGVGCSFDDNMRKLLGDLGGVSDRSAKFVCVLSFTRSSEETLYFRGELEGQITKHPRGAGGFGYDPVFEVVGTGLTLAELKGQNIKIDTHRTRAVELWLQQISPAQGPNR